MILLLQRRQTAALPRSQNQKIKAHIKITLTVSTALMSAFAARNACTTSKWQLAAAQWKGVEPFFCKKSNRNVSQPLKRSMCNRKGRLLRSVTYICNEHSALFIPRRQRWHLPRRQATSSKSPNGPHWRRNARQTCRAVRERKVEKCTKMRDKLKNKAQ